MLSLDIQIAEMASHLLHLGIAYLLAVPIGLNRERKARSAGLRTFPLVAMAACGYMITGMYVLDSSDAEARVLYGIITGIGFIGGGAILKDGGTVSGTATAASIWTTGAIGIAVAFQRYEIAILLCIMTFVTLSLGQRLKDKVRS